MCTEYAPIKFGAREKKESQRTRGNGVDKIAVDS